MNISSGISQTNVTVGTSLRMNVTCTDNNQLRINVTDNSTGTYNTVEISGFQDSPLTYLYNTTSILGTITTQLKCEDVVEQTVTTVFSYLGRAVIITPQDTESPEFFAGIGSIVITIGTIVSLIGSIGGAVFIRRRI